MSIKILVIDDEQSICKLVASALDRQDCEVTSAYDVPGAIELINNNEYDLIISDKNIPDIDGSDEGGLTIIKTARKKLPDCEIILMTGYGTLDSAIEALRLGAFDYILKPFSIAELVEKVDRLIEYKGFINPKNIINTYKNFQTEIHNIFAQKDSGEAHHSMNLINNLIDHFLRIQKEWENVIIEQKDALAKIEGLSEQLKETSSLSEDSIAVVEKISQNAKRRI